MAENIQQKSVGKNNSRSGIFGQFSSERKKVITGCCLLGVMLILWGRVLMGRKPAEAQAADGNRSASSASAASETKAAVKSSKIRFIELPKIQGRNDEITRDIFSINKVKNVANNNGNNQSAVTVAQQELAGQIKKMLKLEAIGMGEQKQAFINNKLLCEGDKLTVDNGDTKYECEIVRILETEVDIKCQEVEIKLELANPNEVIDG